MSADGLHYEFVCIEGNIGSGKTTLAKLLADRFNTRLMCETFEDNPFLPIFYQDPERYAFPVELHFMAERQKQIQQFCSTIDLFAPGIIADYCPQKSLLFAHHTLSLHEFKLFKTLYHALFEQLKKPDLIIYLHRDIQELLRLIHQRGRTYELGLQSDYLLKVHQAYQSFFSTLQEIPVLWLNVTKVDFLADRSELDTIAEILNTIHSGGTHYYDLSN